MSCGDAKHHKMEQLHLKACRDMCVKDMKDSNVGRSRSAIILHCFEIAQVGLQHEETGLPGLVAQLVKERTAHPSRQSSNPE